MIDLLTMNRSFYIGTRYTFKTPLGGILSIIFALLIIPVCYLLSRDFLHGTQPKVVRYSVNGIDDWDKLNYTTMISYPRNLLNKTLLLEKDIDTNTLYFKAQFKECNVTEYNYITAKPRDNTMIYLCNSFDRFLYRTIVLIDCMKTSFYELGHPSIADECTGIYNQTDRIAYSQAIAVSSFNKLKIHDPTDKMVVEMSAEAGNSHLETTLNFNKLENDLGLFFKQPIISYYYSPSWYGRSPGGDEYLAQTYITTNQTFVVEKSYIKLQEHLTGLIAIIRLLFLAINFVNWDDFLYCRYFLKHYLAKNPKSIKQSYLDELKTIKMSKLNLNF
jgi:hypothetical protein